MSTRIVLSSIGATLALFASAEAVHAATIANGTWQVSLACGPYEGPGQVKSPGSWTVPVAMTIVGNRVTWSRRGEDSIESLSGLVQRDGALQLTGEGRWTLSPDKPWYTQVNAWIDHTGTKLEGRAVISTDRGDISRRCTVAGLATELAKQAVQTPSTPLAPAAPSQNPLSPTASFDCKKASSQVEHLVCGSSSLASLDSSLAAAYKVALGRDPSAREQQIAWLRDTRNRCADVECLTTAYQEQIHVMRGTESVATIANMPQPMPVAQIGSPLTCPIDWSALADISGPNPDKLILGIKARDWNKAQVDQLLVQEAECQRVSTDPDTVKKVGQKDLLSRVYPNALAALERRDQQLQREALRQQQEVARALQADQEQQQERKREAAISTYRTEQEAQRLQREAASIQRAEQEVKQQAKRQEAQKEQNMLLAALAAVAAAIGGWFWNKFIRNRCPKCKSTDFDTTKVSEVDRWRGSKKVTEQHSRGTRTRYISATYVKKVYNYRCNSCQTGWSVSAKEEL